MNSYTEEARLFRLSQGWWPFQVPYGYKKSTRNKSSVEISIDEEQSKKVIYIFEQFTAAKSNFNRVHNDALNSGIILPSRSCISKILRSTFYIGFMEYNGVSYPHNYPVFLDKNLFEQAQLILKDIPKNKKTNLKQIDERMKKGIWDLVPIYGYRRKNLKLIKHEKNAQIVHDIFDAYVKGKTPLEINNFLTEKYNCRILKNIYHIVNNKFYMGIISWKGEFYEHIYPRIITKEMFYAAQKIYENRDKRDIKI